MSTIRFTRVAALAMVTAGAVMAQTAPAHAQAVDVIRWPQAASRVELAGPPDNRFVTVSPDQEAWATQFGCGTPYANLAALLGVPLATLASADVIAFEGNGGSPGESGGWESSKWLFSDGVNSLTVVRDAVSGTSSPAGVLLADASISAADYERFFGLAPIGETVVSFMLFDLPPGIDVSSPAFKLIVKGYPAGEGTPDPDTIGIFSRGCGCAAR